MSRRTETGDDLPGPERTFLSIVTLITVFVHGSIGFAALLLLVGALVALF